MNLRGRKRQRLLAWVYNTWIDGVLQPSLADVPYISLPLLSWRIDEEHKVSPHIPLLSSDLVDAYVASQERLVILGDEGSGKTTLLLELLRGLLQRAEQNEQTPIPVMFHLSSWATKCQPLEKWLVEEWRTLYPACAFKPGEFLLLLDGLDSVREELRDTCLRAINTYHETYNQIPLVFCCRNADYERFQLFTQSHSAVQIQPLSDKKMNMVTALSHNSTQLDITSRDQMKSIYNLCEAYVQSQLIRQPDKDTDPRESIQSRLMWLASHLWQDQISEIHLEQLWPRWLPSRKWIYFYRLLMSLMTLFTTFFIIIDLTKAWYLPVIFVWLVLVLIVFLQRRPIDVTTNRIFLRFGWLWLGFTRLGEIFLVLHIPQTWTWVLLGMVVLFILGYIINAINKVLDDYVLPAYSWIMRAGRCATLAFLFIILLFVAFEGMSRGVPGIDQGLYPDTCLGLCFGMAIGGDVFIEQWRVCQDFCV